MKRFLALTLAVALAFIGVPVPLAAAIGPQGPGSISGVAKGGDQQPLPNYTVRVRNVGTGQIAGTQTTSATGAFSFTGLNAGTYVVEIVDAAGRVIGVTSSISLTAGTMVISGVALTASGLGGAALAGAAGGGIGTFFSSTAGILLIVGAGAGITAGVLASRNASPSR